jgi:hypothetical protein
MNIAPQPSPQSYPFISYSFIDAGWGCTLRATQMLVAHTLWVAEPNTSLQPTFDDDLGSLGLRALVLGAPPRWYTPSSAARAMAAAAARACPPLPLTLFVVLDATLVLEEVPPPPALLLFPMVLAPCDTLPPSAARSLSEAARDSFFAGFVGGPPGRALFCPTVGAVGAGGGGGEPTAHVLDPHAEVAAAAQPLRRRVPSQLALKEFSPSLAVAFFLRTVAERDAFVARLRGPSPLLSLAVVERRPAARSAASSGRGEAEEYDFADVAGGGDGAPAAAAAAAAPGPPPRWGANLAHRFAASLRALARAWGLVGE